MGGPQQSLPNFQNIVDPSFLQDQQANLYQQLLSQRSGLGQTDFGAAFGQPGQGQQGFSSLGGYDPYSMGYGFDPSMLTSLFG